MKWCCLIIVLLLSIIVFADYQIKKRDKIISELHIKVSTLEYERNK